MKGREFLDQLLIKGPASWRQFVLRRSLICLLTENVLYSELLHLL
jgi:hypothetical protein